ncbi:sugar kinase [Paenarthrobacter sp. NPDC089675]|uniref:sugar kinase n=1 Tax=Paenarthrobacter TaxID=1742992 RepID=UPI0037F3DBA6
MSSSVLTFGETMAMISTDHPGVLSRGAAATWSFGGADSNVAVGLARLGVPVTWIGRVGDDQPGRMIVRGLRGEGIDVVAVSDPNPTGLMLKFRRTSDRVNVAFRRSHSAGSFLAPEDLLHHASLGEARIVHCTGITPALSDSSRSATFAAVKQARSTGALVSLDVNYRPTLWDRQDAAACISELAQEADIVFASPEELDLALPEGIDCFIQGRHGRTVIIKDGARGAHGYDAEAQIQVPAVPITVQDAVGAGDAFVAGYLSALLDGAPMAQCLQRAVVTGAFACLSTGDWEGAPYLEELSLLADNDPVSR